MQGKPTLAHPRLGRGSSSASSQHARWRCKEEARRGRFSAPWGRCLDEIAGARAASFEFRELDVSICMATGGRRCVALRERTAGPGGLRMSRCVVVCRELRVARGRRSARGSSSSDGVEKLFALCFIDEDCVGSRWASVSLVLKSSMLLHHIMPIEWPLASQSCGYVGLYYRGITHCSVGGPFIVVEASI